MKDVFFMNAKIYSMEKEGQCFEAMHVRTGRINKLYKQAADATAESSGFETVNLGGKTVIPGMTDTHAHFIMTIGASAMGERVSEVTPEGLMPADLAGVREKFTGVSNEKKGKQPLLFYNYVIPSIAETRLPTKTELDEWIPGREVIIISMDGHSSSYSTPALSAIGLKDPEGNGILTGEAHEFNMGKVNSFVQSKIGLGMLLKAAIDVTNDAVAHGLTCMHCLDGFDDDPKDMTVWFITRVAAALQIKLRLYVQYLNPKKILPHSKFMRMKRIGGCAAWEMDGSVSSQTAAFYDEYRSKPGYTGECYYAQEKVDGLVEAAHDAGCQITSHALGPRAIEVLLSAYEKLLAKKGDARNSMRHRIDHFEFPTEDQVERAVRNGLLLAVQPGFSWFDEKYQKGYRQFLSDKVFNMQVPLKRIASIGGMLLGGSDSPVQHFNPFLHIQGMVSFPLEDQRLTVYEALRTYTYNAAYATFEENDRGTMAEGKLADFAVLDSDPFTADLDEIRNIRVVDTYIGGRKYRPLRNPWVLLIKALAGFRSKV
jgi:predicted amidohydrolase YtcJ